MDQITIQNFVLQLRTIATTNEVGANALHKALVSFSPHKLVTLPPPPPPCFSYRLYEIHIVHTKFLKGR